MAATTVSVVGSNGVAVLLSDGDQIGAMLSSDGTFTVGLLGSMIVMSDWTPVDRSRVSAAKVAEIEAEISAQQQQGRLPS